MPVPPPGFPHQCGIYEQPPLKMTPPTGAPWGSLPPPGVSPTPRATRRPGVPSPSCPPPPPGCPGGPYGRPPPYGNVS
jgi:hypothetical protein